MRLYHFIDSTHGLENIRSRRLKISTIDRLNDPFEFMGVASRDKEIRKRYSSLKDGLAKYTGIVCFSEGWKNPLLWSHYADRHRGLCLGFDVGGEIHKVRYQKRRLPPDIRALESEATAKAHVRALVTTKFSHWQYEREYRLFAQLKDKDEGADLYFISFNRTLRLREVIVGPCSSIARPQVTAAVGHLPGVRLVKSRLAFRSFRVVEQRDTSRWK
jgi:hypothetical protein